MVLTDVTGLFSHALALAVLGAAMLPTRTNVKTRVATIVVVFVLAWLPVNGLPLAAYPRGIVGDLSITACVLLMLSILRGAGATAPWLDASRVFGGRRVAWCLGLALLALAFYVMALGASTIDPYRWGYASYGLIAAMSAIACFAWWQRAWVMAIAVALALLAWVGGWYESSNLWDYLIDPLLAVYALGVVVKRAVDVGAGRVT